MEEENLPPTATNGWSNMVEEQHGRSNNGWSNNGWSNMAGHQRLARAANGWPTAAAVPPTLASATIGTVIPIKPKTHRSRVLYNSLSQHMVNYEPTVPSSHGCQHLLDDAASDDAVVCRHMAASTDTGYCHHHFSRMMHATRI